jgi:hypothetical protein
MKMIERLLFDRIDAKTGGAAVGGEHHLAADILANEAGAALAFVQLAIAWTEIALNAFWPAFGARQAVPPAPRVG